jgi:Protein of unknown function (DUF429)
VECELVTSRLDDATLIELLESADRAAIDLTQLGTRQGTSVDRVDGKVIECYPSAALYCFGFTRPEVKGAKTDPSVRSRLLDAILARAPWLQLDDGDKTKLTRTSDAFDAFVSALVARAAALRLTQQPPAQFASLAALEGWIHLRVPGALAKLGEETRASGAPLHGPTMP